MPNVTFRDSRRTLTSHAGLSIIGQCFEITGVDSKEGVSRTYQKVDSHTPIAAYLGNEGWCLGLELRPGKQHTMKESNAFLERALPRAKGWPSKRSLGFDSQAHLELLEQQRLAFSGTSV